MGEWDYYLETYKVTMHYKEVLIQALVWPVTAFVVLGGLWLFFGKSLCALLTHAAGLLKRVENIGAGDWSIKLKAESEVVALKAEKALSITDDKQALTDAEIVLLYIEQVEAFVDRLRELVETEQARGNFLDRAFDFSNNEGFIRSFYYKGSGFERSLELYEILRKWEQKANAEPQGIGPNEAKKAATGALFFVSGLALREKALYDVLLDNERKKVT